MLKGINRRQALLPPVPHQLSAACRKASRIRPIVRDRQGRLTASKRPNDQGQSVDHLPEEDIFTPEALSQSFLLNKSAKTRKRTAEIDRLRRYGVLRGDGQSQDERRRLSAAEALAKDYEWGATHVRARQLRLDPSRIDKDPEDIRLKKLAAQRRYRQACRLLPSPVRTLIERVVIQGLPYASESDRRERRVMKAERLRLGLDLVAQFYGLGGT